jgi:serine/threonine protein kinase
MTAFQTRQCPQCGTVRAVQAAPLDLCPACLLATALAIADEPCPYQVLAPIGQGASGVTYLAQALSGVGGYVALRILRPRDDVDAVLLRYQHYKQALAQIEHPSVGRLLAVGLTADGLLYVASDYVTGWPLTAIGSHASMSIDERGEVMRQLTAGIDAVHAAGMVHLTLDASHVKISTAKGLHATILGLGSSVIVDGAAGAQAVDRRALAQIADALGVA